MHKILLLTCLLAGLVQAAEYETHTPNNIEAGEGDGLMGFFKNKAPVIPTEQEIQYPDLATLKQWAPVKFAQEIKNNNYYLSLDSLSLGPDRIVRYVIVVTPKAGGPKNILFEGIDCKSNQYRTYAWGNPNQNEWQKSTQVKWKPLSKNQYNAWQGSLSDNFCQMGDPWPVETIRKDFTVDKQAGDCLGCRAK
ncbi:CNP1-like family protein [uncultured Deefgea sp.]|uniref:CNP1-like family protein n=1 Tax=uncultured Deefgea sp. TaxID=1304914 RepID=UPI002624D03E|nr:CNP1-like family protein [uncultured Deefgea sp.]